MLGIGEGMETRQSLNDYWTDFNGIGKMFCLGFCQRRKAKTEKKYPKDDCFIEGIHTDKLLSWV